MSHLVSAALLVAGVIHLLPLAGVVGGARLNALYGIPFDDSGAALLMRHRAVLFGMLGLFLVVAAFRPALQATALLAGQASVVSFLILAAITGPHTPPIERVVLADRIALVALALGTAAWALTRRRSA